MATIPEDLHHEIEGATLAVREQLLLFKDGEPDERASRIGALATALLGWCIPDEKQKERLPGLIQELNVISTAIDELVRDMRTPKGAHRFRHAVARLNRATAELEEAGKAL